jgi:hypothetical protein
VVVLVHFFKGHTTFEKMPGGDEWIRMCAAFKASTDGSEAQAFQVYLNEAPRRPSWEEEEDEDEIEVTDEEREVRAARKKYYIQSWFRARENHLKLSNPRDPSHAYLELVAAKYGREFFSERPNRRSFIPPRAAHRTGGDEEPLSELYEAFVAEKDERDGWNQILTKSAGKS